MAYKFYGKYKARRRAGANFPKIEAEAVDNETKEGGFMDISVQVV